MDVDEVCRKLWMVRRACDNAIVMKMLPFIQCKPKTRLSKRATQKVVMRKIRKSKTTNPKTFNKYLRMNCQQLPYMH